LGCGGPTVSKARYRSLFKAPTHELERRNFNSEKKTIWGTRVKKGRNQSAFAAFTVSGNSNEAADRRRKKNQRMGRVGKVEEKWNGKGNESADQHSVEKKKKKSWGRRDLRAEQRRGRKKKKKKNAKRRLVGKSTP